MKPDKQSTYNPRINFSIGDIAEEKKVTPAEEAKPASAKAPGASSLTDHAQKGDIVELHKRVGEKFQALPAELSLQIEEALAPGVEQTKTIFARLDKVETSLDGIEAALRIELPPHLDALMQDKLSEFAAQKGRSWRLARCVALIAVGVVLGALFHAPIAETGEQVLAAVSQQVEQLVRR